MKLNNMNTIIPLRYEFEYEHDTACIWINVPDLFDYPSPSGLRDDYGFSWKLTGILEILSDWYMHTINMSDPHGGLDLDPEFIKIFIELEKYAFNLIQKELLDRYTVEYNPSWIRSTYEDNLPTEIVHVAH